MQSRVDEQAGSLPRNDPSVANCCRQQKAGMIADFVRIISMRMWNICKS